MHPELAALLSVLAKTPEDDLLWLAVADWLEENGEAERAELLRLNRHLRGMKKGPTRKKGENRVRELVSGGARPCVPETVNSIGMRLVLIPAGKFWMGSPDDEKGRAEGETLHEAKLTRPFWMGVCPVTQSQFYAVTREDPSWFSERGNGRKDVVRLDTSSFPVESVSCYWAIGFCRTLAERESVDYRLPTDAEWEFACRAGTTTRFHSGDKLGSRWANYNRSLERTRPVEAGLPNAWGLHDMHGNVWEWCQNPLGALGLLRGGGWHAQASQCRSASWTGARPEDGGNAIGFRIVLEHA